MAYDLEEQEQLEQIKAFWARWGMLISATVATVAVSFAVYNGYKYYQRNEAVKALPLFEQLEKAATDLKADPKNPQLVVDLANKLTQEYGKTSQAQLGALLAAKVQADLGKRTESEALLQWVVDNAKDREYSYMARARLALSKIDDNKPEQALSLLASAAPTGFEALYADHRGDAFANSGKKPEAIAEYQKAWTASEKNAALRELIEQKMQLLGAEVIKPITPEKVPA